ncbi:MAG: hypothetical protein HQ546_07445 [Planctomycetes bacterium]|nr:hypothetical protein [Planctomycetota bacterium]
MTGLRTDGATVADHIDRVDLMAAPPMAMNFDGEGGPDGVGVRLYLYRLDGGKVSAVAGGGQVRFEMFEGEIPANAQVQTLPFHTWQFSADQMRLYLGRDPYGLWCYKLPLRWDDHVPATPSITVVAYYAAADGEEIRSAPATIAVK